MGINSLPLNQLSCIIKGSISSLACDWHSYSYVDVQSFNQLNQLNLCFRLVPFVHFGSSIRQLFINRLQEVPSRTFSPFRASSSETSSPPCIRTSSNLFSTLLRPGTPNFHFVIRSLQMYLHLVEVLMSAVSAFHPIL